MPLTASFPTSLDSLANPTATTNRDDPGFELDEVVSRIHDILEALEAKVGIGATTPSAAGVLRQTAPGVSAWGKAVPADLTGAGSGDANTVLATVGGTTVALQQIATGMIAANAVGIRRLDYLHASDINGVAITASPYDVTSDQTFTVGTASSLIQIACYGYMFATVDSGTAVVVARLVIDNSGSPQAAQFRANGGAFGPATAAVVNPIGGRGLLTLNNLVAGTHTVRLQMLTTSGGVHLYCRAATTSESLTLQVTEIQR